MAIGFKLPFAKSSGSLGYFDMTQDVPSAAGTNLKSLLLTNWGERVNHYNLGCNLTEFLFENDDEDDLRQRITDRILSQVSMWMPFVIVDDIRVSFSDQDGSIPEHGIGIRLSFHLSNRPDLKDVLELPIFP